MYAGIEAGGTKFVCALGTGPDDVVAHTSFPTTAPEETLGQAVAFLTAEQDRHGPVEAVGIASFGPVDLHEGSPTYGHITSTPKPGWQQADVVGAVRRALDVPVGFDTDVNGAALAEGRWGAAQGLDTFAYVTVGTGIGMGALVGGNLVHGLLHPEAGHLLVRRHPDDAFVGSCPFHGDCLEGLASGPALERRWGRPGTDLGPELARAVELEAWYLAQLAASLTYVVSPQRIVFGGGVLNLPGLLDATARATVGLFNGYLTVPGDHLVPPGLGDRAGVLGGIALADLAVRT